ncbi:MAG: Dihydropteroate synthase [Candidatus Heimdallarchaeota archaeon LC_2]|nr:MAG: Dihydropteroate synthase [Candidatus Heimdallarchaeota archaeon LC_2]
MIMPFNWSEKTYVMGIVNITHDSFSGDGVFKKPLTDIIKQVKQFVSWGADIIDIGGESTRPGSTLISTDDELNRVIPVIKAIKAEINVPISIDTYKSKVAREALNAGANWVNDVWGLRMDPNMADVVAEASCPIIIMHNRSKPKDVSQQDQLGGRYVDVEYDNLIEEIQEDLLVSINLALSKGVDKNNIIIDPGIGFGKTVEQNLQIINNLNKFQSMGFPILLGSSRKSFIGYTLDLSPNERIEGTAASISIGIQNGANIVRVHDVKFMSRIARMTDAIIRS